MGHVLVNPGPLRVNFRLLEIYFLALVIDFGLWSHFCLRFDFRPLWGFSFIFFEVDFIPLGTDFVPFGVDFRHLGVILALKRQF